MKPVVFIGMMGCGKSFVSKEFAIRYGLEHYEMDAMIENDQGMVVAEIFEKYGEDYFRTLESKMLAELLDNKRQCVISCGGGIVTCSENVDVIKRQAVSVWLKTDVHVLLERVDGGKGRPMLLQGSDPEGALVRLLNMREGLYSRADIHIENNGVLDIETLIDDIAEAIVLHIDKERN